MTLKHTSTAKPFTPMKIAYIAHPIKGDIKRNLKQIKLIGRQINLQEPNIIPFAPYFFDIHTLNDNIPKERQKGIKNNITLMGKGFIDQLRLYGDKISPGMKQEIDMAIKLGIEIIPMTPQTKHDLESLKLTKM
jgi:hypothetical protein